MNDCEFIQERETDSERRSTVLNGWETVVFQVEDLPAEGDEPQPWMTNIYSRA